MDLVADSRRSRRRACDPWRGGGKARLLRLGLHAGPKAVSLRAMAAVRLKCALRHGTALLNFISMEECCPADTLKNNATSGQRLSISIHPVIAAKYVLHDAFFHNAWCNSLFEKNLPRKPQSFEALLICASIGIRLQENFLHVHAGCQSIEPTQRSHIASEAPPGTARQWPQRFPSSGQA